MNPAKTKFCKRFLATARLVALLCLFFAAPKLQAFSAADADTIFKAYTKAFYFTNADGGFFRATTDGGKTVFWDRAEQMEMLLDVYERTTNDTGLVMFSNVFQGFIADHGTNWENNEFNDDIMWMVIACARAQQLTGKIEYRDLAKSNFDMCYARAWSTNLGGGLWWKTPNLSKNACVNGPASIAAFLLFQISGDTNYLAKSEATYEWERAHLFDTNSGQIYDNMDFNGEIDPKCFTYNQGTFIGAANFLGHFDDARRAADHTKNVLCREGILPDYDQFGDAGGFNGIFARWTARFMLDRGLQKKYLVWLQANADAAWKERRADDNLVWSRWAQPTPARPLSSWACSSSVVIMHVVPPNPVNANSSSAEAGAVKNVTAEK
jgi:predicted alpha-1,6-mannanase (GH76 family)